MKLLNTDLTIEDLYIKQDLSSGLVAIIAIHNTKNGPALGGCRFVNYASVDEAMLDAMKLAKAMTYKSAMAGLPLGGGKAVIISHPGIRDRKKIFESFGDLVNQLNGKYITASDSGSTEDDMQIVATRTPFVTSINKSKEVTDDTAAMTAIGILKAIEAAVEFKLHKNKLENVHVAIQGVGKVGFLLAKLLLEKGARITMSDKKNDLLEERAHQLGAGIQMVDPNRITEIACDVFSPCALGGVINKLTIEKMQASIICGAANNQLHDSSDGELLRAKGILYVPDYVANAGGVICAAAQANTISKDESYLKVTKIYESVMEIMELATTQNLATNLVANHLAEQRFA